MRPSILLSTILTLATVASADGEPPTVDAATGTHSKTRALLESYSADYQAVSNFHRVPTSPRSISRIEELYQRYQKALKEISFDELSRDERIDYLLFRGHLEHGLRSLAIQRDRNEEISPLVPFAEVIVELEQSRRRMKPIKPEKAAEKLAKLAAQIKQTCSGVEAGLDADQPSEGAIKANKVSANRAARITKELQDTLKRWYDFYHGYDPLFTWWAGKPYENADRELTQYASFLRERIVGAKKGEPDPLIGDPIGHQALLSELAREMICYTPEELIAIANREFAWCEAELVRASRQLGYGDDWPKALEHVKTLHVAPGRQDDLVRKLANEAIEYIDSRELVTIPPLCRKMWTLAMMSTESQATTPYMSYGGNRVNVAFPTNEMSHEQKLMSMRGNNIHFSRAVVHHELIPGHHLQMFMARRHRTYRYIFRTVFLVEGWPLYWEMLLWDLGFARSPEDRIGMLFWRMHRCARIIVSLNFHLEKMKPEKMIDFLVEKVGHERDGATAEVRRYIGDEYEPLYQCAYMVGGLQIRALHKELVGSGEWTNRRFHDAILRENCIPIEMIRASLTKQELTPEFSSNWKFSDAAADKD